MTHQSSTGSLTHESSIGSMTHQSSIGSFTHESSTGSLTSQQMLPVIGNSGEISREPSPQPPVLVDQYSSTNSYWDEDEEATENGIAKPPCLARTTTPGATEVFAMA